MSRRFLRPKPRISYYELEEPNLDEYMFCEKCGDYVYEYCAIHGALLVVPDDKVPVKHNFPSFVPRAALTIPHVFLHLNYSTIPGAGLGVFSTLALPKGVRFGPYRGERTTEITSDYSWQIYGPDRKPSHVIDAADGNKSNWMRYVNCARHWREQNLVAFQYRGQLYYRTIKTIPRFTELMVFYGSEYANKLNIDLGKYNSPKSYAQKFGAPVPKKSCLSKLEPKSNKKNELEKSLQEKENNNEKKEIKLSTTTPAVTAQNKKNTRKRSKEDNHTQKEAPKIKRRKIDVFNKNKNENITNKPVEQDSETVLEETKINRNEETVKPQFKQTVNAINDEMSTKNISHKTDLTKSPTTTNNKHIKKKILPSIQNNQSKKQKILIKIEDAYLTCEECKYQTVCKKTLERHMRFHDVTRKLICEICLFRFSDEHVLNSHKISHAFNSNKVCNSDTSSSTTERQEKLPNDYLKHAGFKLYNCNYCDYTCNRAGHLKSHIITHTGEKPYTCNICKYKCNHASALKRHIRTHTGEKPYTCNICKYKFNEAGHLKRHIRTHTGEKPYTCNICKYKFNEAGHLKRHIRTHTGEKPYTCNICKYKCNEASALKIHIRTHTGEKPYACDKCKYKCNQASSLKIHIRTHTGEKPYTCNICKYRCNKASALKSHIRTHTGEKPYTCDICDYKCTQSSSLKSHLKNKHLS